MDKIKLAQRTIALLSSMIESGERHTARSREMKDNALEGLEQLRKHDVVERSEQLKAFAEMVSKDDLAYLKDAETLLKEFESL